MYTTINRIGTKPFNACHLNAIIYLVLSMRFSIKVDKKIVGTILNGKGRISEGQVGPKNY